MILKIEMSIIIYMNMDCPVCGFTVNLLEFSEHLKEDVAEIRAKYKYVD